MGEPRHREREVEAERISQGHANREAPIAARCGEAADRLLTGLRQDQSFLIGACHPSL